jgi:RNA polymerase sigma factor (sigma-70 family)
MTDLTDEQCLSAFIRDRDETAFARLVERFAPLVYSAARRQSIDADAAQDIAQAVFIVLAKKAAGIKSLNLPGWLVKTTYLVASQWRRDEARRRRRERIAASMVPNMIQPDVISDADWQQIAPLLDNALCRLSQPDRNIVSMRYLQQRSIAEIAADMALTQAAARKRVERAIAQLRRHFAGRGVEIGTTAIGACMISHGAQQLPLGLAETFAHGALAAAHTACAASSAALLAKGVILMTTAKKVGIAAVLLLMFASIGGLATVIKVYLSDSAEPSATAPAASNSPTSIVAPATPVAAADRIRVGIYLSDYTATGPHWIPQNYGFGDQVKPVRALEDPSIDLEPVVEPGTEDTPQLARLLNSNFPGKKPLDSASLEDLQTLDVLVAQAAHNVPAGTQTAIHEAVHQGLGFLNRGFMTVQPGFTPLYGDLAGMKAVNYGYNMGPVECEIVGDSPLLGDLSGHVGKTMMIEPAGPLGRLSGIPLIRVSDMSQINRQPPRRLTAGSYMYPFYLSQFGKGRIIAFAFAHYEVPQVLNSANHGRFYIHCVQWLAGKPLS